MGEEHLDLLAELGRYFVLARFSDGTSDVPGIFVLLVCDLADTGIRAALCF